MCMQDLAISLRCQRRRVTGLVSTPSGFTMVPSSPIRVMLWAYDTGVGNVPNISLADTASSSSVNAGVDGAGVRTVLQSWVSALQQPGVFSDPLYVQCALGQADIWEAVMDTNLDKAVQAINRDIGP